MIWLTLALQVTLAQAAPSHVRISPEQELYVDHKQAAPGKPTIVLLNGLTYLTHSWDDLVKSLLKRDAGLGIVRYDMKGMGQTLLNDSLPVTYEIPYSQQIEQLHLLLEKLEVRDPVLVGLSYGGGIAIPFAAKYPQLGRRIVLLAPFTKPLAAQDEWIKQQVAATRATYPNNPASDDELYDYFLRQFIYSVYPSAEPVVLSNPFKLEAIFRMVQGIRKLVMTPFLSRLPEASVHLVTAKQDQYIPKTVMEEFWAELPASKRLSRLEIDGSEHKIPEAAPDFASAWIQAVAADHPLLRDGRSFSGDVSAHRAVSDDGAVILLPNP